MPPYGGTPLRNNTSSLTTIAGHVSAICTPMVNCVSRKETPFHARPRDPPQPVVDLTCRSVRLSITNPEWRNYE